MLMPSFQVLRLQFSSHLKFQEVTRRPIIPFALLYNLLEMVHMKIFSLVGARDFYSAKTLWAEEQMLSFDYGQVFRHA